MKILKKAFSLSCCVAALLVAGSCRSRTDRSAGPVALTFGDVTGIPISISVSGTLNFTGSGQPPGTFTTFTLVSVIKEPNVNLNALSNIETSSYQVVYKRRDSGTRLPPPLVAALTVEVPAGGTTSIRNLPIVRLDQLLSPPLSDLGSGGRDRETGTQVIVLDAQITFFGRTVSGDSVSSGTAVYTIEFIP